MNMDRIVCLANSYKHQHRCVAGISLLTKRWVRLVGRSVPGCLTVEETSYADGSEAGLLDVFEAELGEGCGSHCHPEDVYVTGKPWRPVRRFDKKRDLAFLKDYLNKRSTLLQDCSDRIYMRKFSDAPVSHSLELVQPKDLWWWIREEAGKRKYRALFRLGNVGRVRYDLPVTDPRWLDQFRSRPLGLHPHSSFFSREPLSPFFAVSLSEAFEKFHYKIVAGVINLPA